MTVTAHTDSDGEPRFDIDPGPRGALYGAPWFAASVHLAILGLDVDTAAQLLSDALYEARRRP